MIRFDHSNNRGNRFSLTISVLDNGVWRNVFNNNNLSSPNSGTNRNASINVTNVSQIRITARDIGGGSVQFWLREIEITDI